MIKKLLLMVFLVLVQTVVFGQTDGDYRSVASGNWITLGNWQYYNGSTWLTPSGTSPQGYPGQFSGTGTVTIRDGNDIIISNSPSNSFSALVIGGGTSGNLIVGADVNVQTLNITINAGAKMKFSGNNHIVFPANAALSLSPGGSIDDSGTCNNNVAVYIGTVKYAVCAGSGNATYSFAQVNSGLGTLNSNPGSYFPFCGNVANLIGTYSGVINTAKPVTYLWAGSGPSPVLFSNNTNASTSATISTPGIYSFTLTVTNDGYSNYETISVIFIAAPSAPLVGTITQPTCELSTGSVVLSGLPATWTLTRSPGGVETSGTGTSTTISGLASGTYTYTVSNGGCTSAASTNVAITSPVKEWNGSVSSDWNTAANWTPIGVPTSSNCVSIPNVARPAIISGTNFIAYANTLTILNSGRLTVNSSNTITVTDFVDVALGFLVFENTASLVQINNVPTKENKGFIDYKRTTNARPTDYTYWSSPVSPMELGELYPNEGTYYSYEATISGEDWKQEGSNTEMVAGKGYIANQGAAIPQPGLPPPPGLLDVIFTGVPNNGHYEINAIADRSYLLGNPYPSALDAETFLNDNAGVLNGTLYFWTHNTAIQDASNIAGTAGSGAFAYTSNDYATYNATGGVAANQRDIDPNTDLPYLAGGGSAPSGSAVPTGKIASGQGFFASSKTAITDTKIVFNNSMRVGVNDITGNNTQFFKTRNQNEKTTNTIEKNRLWLNLSNAQGAFKQTLVGYITDATNDYDERFDGESYDGNEFVDFYSVNQDKNLVIQGRALPFDENDEVMLGFRTTIEGAFTINIDQVDGLLTNQAVFIEDKLTNTIFDLKNGNYTFNTVAGTFDDRFVLKYTNKTLGTKTFDSLEKTVLVSNKNKQIKIDSSVEMIDKVTVFDLLGRQIYQKINVNSNELSIFNLVSNRQIVIVKTVLQNGQEVSNKIVY